MNVNPYLLFNGQCEEAFRFYEQCTGGTIESMLRNREAPIETDVPEDWSEKIMHMRMRIGDNVLMASDAPPGHQSEPGGFSISLQVDTPEEAERCFAALSEGAEIRMPIQKTFWALRFGMLTDRFGMPWMINCQAPEQ